MNVKGAKISENDIFRLHRSRKDLQKQRGRGATNIRPFQELVSTHSSVPHEIQRRTEARYLRKIRSYEAAVGFAQTGKRAIEGPRVRVL